MQEVIFSDLGKMSYRQAWDYQEELLQKNVRIKSEWRKLAEMVTSDGQGAGLQGPGLSSAGGVGAGQPATIHHLLFVEHPPVYTLGKSGQTENLLISEETINERGMEFFRTNRGGDITFHGPGQIVGYPVLDLEKFYTDIGKYLRSLEEVIIRVLAEYGIRGDRSPGETGVWIEPGVRGRERKICAIGIRCSRWITMHGFAFNINTDLANFGNIIPCGISDKQVTSLEKELGRPVSLVQAKDQVKRHFGEVFGVEFIS
jgi:lipoyl(octanoyl) transferase